ncbi:RNA polymerase sigma factor [Paenibacillus oryzisoli]|uniref:RNA polymerase subunit sigma-24 n=1 Tax=Paenibacillus oryzisoli TaxID=1850517 RepID=A0A198ANS2_9BACL|nr:sigma-70 family RNA polymerase sigma factor [Paenibacillus oryzisoli]OAS22745.1 RNA polymerase subunit sigma-24 [Paenibacillus oryzisoli]
MNETMDDRQLMHLVSQKDSEALETLYDRYEQMIYNFAFRIVKDAMAAEEVMQELFMRVWNGSENYDHAQGRLTSWMFAITRNIAIDHLRRRSSRTAQQTVDRDHLNLIRDKDTTEEIVELRIIGEHVKEALQGLNPDQQEVVDMIYYQGMTQQEVADLASIPLGTVKSRVRLAMKQLQQRLSHWGRRDRVHDGH